MASGKELFALKGHTGEVTGVAFSPDGQRLASVSKDGTVKILETVPLPLEILHQRELREWTFDLVESLFATGMLRAEAIQSLRDNPRLSETLRQAALTLAEHSRLDPQALNSVSWAVVRQPDGSGDAYGRALLQAEEACRLEPDNGNYLNTLGVAQYRLGQYQAAVETLARSDIPPEGTASFLLLAGTRLGRPAGSLAFLAMAQYQLGRKEQAQATLTRLREAMTKSRWVKDPESAAFLREAETLIEAAPATKK